MTMPAVLAIVADSDDIEFVAVGTLLRLRDAGWRTHYLNLSSGDCGSMTTDLDETWTRPGRDLDETRAIREAEGRAAAPVPRTFGPRRRPARGSPAPVSDRLILTAAARRAEKQLCPKNGTDVKEVLLAASFGVPAGSSRSRNDH